MGRKTISIQKIENKIPREYAFVQRKRGLIKKAIELAVLCDKEVFLAIYDHQTQRMCEYFSNEDFNVDMVNQIMKTAEYTLEKFTNDDLELLSNPQLTQKMFEKHFQKSETRSNNASCKNENS
jgi:hypothetical protein